MTILTEQQQTLRTEIVDALKKGIVVIVFVKGDGTERTMRCTLSENHLPPRPEVPEGSVPPPKKKRPESMVAVWDVEKDDWRSFTIPSVISWKPDN